MTSANKLIKKVGVDVDVSRRVRGSDGQGGTTHEFVVVWSGKCRLSFSSSGPDRMERGKDTATATVTAYFPTDADILKGDRANIEDTDYDVERVIKNQTGDAYIEAQLEEKQHA